MPNLIGKICINSVRNCRRKTMSLVPEFELGLWNAWIFTLPIIVISILGPRILGKRASEEASSSTEKVKTVSNLSSLVILLPFAYSIFLPLKLDTIWFVTGLLTYLLAMFFVVTGLLNFATTSVNELVTKGVYGISRNPGYLGMFLVNVGIGVACLSWVFLLVAIANFLLLRWYVVVVEEPFLIEKYGVTYREYMNRTPRWI
jgi:protein-S-isoprenylcysteine O-methyltransferase Ste14